MAFLQRFWDNVKEGIMNYMMELHARGILLKGPSFIALNPKKARAKGIWDFRHIFTKVQTAFDSDH